MIGTEDEQKYLDRWTTGCFLCKKEGVSRDKMHLISTVIPLENLPAHAAGAVKKYVMVCEDCANGRN